MLFEELQSKAEAGDEGALIELGRRVLDWDVHTVDCDGPSKRYCKYEVELISLQQDLDTEPPPECPHCGKWITEK
jgi:hypothetical protein